MNRLADDTIVARATPEGRGAIGVVRISGPDAFPIARGLIDASTPLEPRRATVVRLALAGPSPRAAAVHDQAVVTTFPGPHSYTGEDVVEMSVHGSPVVIQALLGAAVAAGARLAERGEFTLRAFAHGRLDLVQAEAVADLVDAVTPGQARAAFEQLDGSLSREIGRLEDRLFSLVARLEACLDFPDEGYHFVEPGETATVIRELEAETGRLLASGHRGRLLREGATVAIVGAPNAGKSSLFNALLQANRAIVTPVPGTTRDLLSERTDIAGYAVTLVDTAGIRESGDAIEREGIGRARAAAAAADLVLLVVDAARGPDDGDREMVAAVGERPLVVVLSKSDLGTPPPPAVGRELPFVRTSTLTGEGLDALAAAMALALDGGAPRDEESPVITNLRHLTLLESAREALSHAASAIEADPSVPEEFVLADLQVAGGALQEVAGTRTTDDLLRHIFERFCIGK
ncbi:MAG: tRNA uridine-5-carboxymethylaminomethyl(34) synthesis GTPase MnmE [Vicinamibacterales bacterium]